MYAERAKAVASEGRATRGTEAGADISGWRQPDVMEASSLAVEWQPSEKNETDNHISVTFFLFSPAPVPERICSPLLLLQYFEKPTCF